MAEVVLPGLPAVGGLVTRAALSPRRPDVATHGIPELTVRVAGVKQSLAGLADYDRVTGFTLRDQVPPTWLHVLTFSLQGWVMSRKDFPFPLAGILHVSNDMELLRPVGSHELLDMSVRCVDPRPHAKGVVFDLAGEVSVAGETVWRGTSTYLSGKAKLPGEPMPTLRLDAPEGAPSQQWRLPADLGRQYARVSGDNNPIHTSPLGARLFGLPHPIIHGMWTHARALSALGGRLPEAYRAQVQFAKPLMLPGRAGFVSSESDGQARFAVVNKDAKPHLVGLVTW
ncbi:MAG TPA: hypothetical protein H9987_07950 [Candidatus Luteococcus avicola]|nr:hypothetical protein [Candidatus Luteococcus avicola]